MGSSNRPEEHNRGPPRQAIDPMIAPARGISGWRMSIVAGGAALLGVILFVAIASGWNLLFLGYFLLALAIFFGFSLLIMYLTGAL